MPKVKPSSTFVFVKEIDQDIQFDFETKEPQPCSLLDFAGICCKKKKCCKKYKRAKPCKSCPKH